MNINGIDLNLLKAFEALYTERNVTRAAGRIGLAQPSMSNALNRLRHQFDDQLFVRTPKAMTPTERADSLAPKIRDALALIQSLLAPEHFDPRTAQDEIVIATSDNVALAVGPSLARRLEQEAPGLDLTLLPLDKRTVFRELDDGRLDAVIGTFLEPPLRFHRRDLFEDVFVCIAREGHPSLYNGLDLNTFVTLPHLLMTLNADRKGVVDVRLDELGYQRRIVMTVGSFLTIHDVVAQTDYLATVPQSVATTLSQRAGCAVYPLPFPMKSWRAELIWSQTANASAAKGYVFDQIIALLNGEDQSKSPKT